MTSFASRGIQLREVHRDVLKTSQFYNYQNRGYGGGGEPESPEIRGNSNWKVEAGRMNVTHTEGYKFAGFDHNRPPSVLDQQSNVRDAGDAQN